MGYLLALFPLILLMGLIFNRYLPIQEGWFHWYGRLMEQSKIPYKDFFYFSQPISLFQSELLVRISHQIIIFRIYGFIERVALATSLFVILARRFSPAACSIATLCAMILYQGNNADVLYSYYQTCLLLFLLSQYFLLRSYDRPGSGHLCIFIAGCMSCLAFFTKQSSGAFIIISSIFSLLLLSMDVRSFIASLIPYAVGGLVVTIPFAYYFISNDCLGQYILQVFAGSSSKGSLTGVLFGFIGRALQEYRLLIVFCSFLVLLAVAVRRKWITPENASGGRLWLAGITFLIVLASILIPLATRHHEQYLLRISSSTHFAFLKISIVYCIFFLSSLFSIEIVRRRLFGSMESIDPYSIIMILGTCSWMYSHGLSFAIEEHSSLLGLGLFSAIIWDRSPFNISIWHGRFLPQLALIGLTSGLSFIIAIQKLFFTYAWWGWVERAYGPENHVRVDLPLMRGFRLAASTSGVYSAIYHDISENTGPDDAIFTFPHIPLFNYMTDRRQLSFAQVQYFDVCPDSFAQSAALELAKHPPKILVFFRITEQAWKFHEDAFRGGNRSGQRLIADELDRLTSSGKYVLMQILPDRLSMAPGSLASQGFVEIAL